MIDNMRANGLDPGDLKLPEHLKNKLEEALSEISSTREGRQMIRQAARRGEDGKVNIIYNEGGFTVALISGDFAVGTEDDQFMYQGVDGDMYDLSIQRMVFHELVHLGLGHEEFSLENESEAVRVTNQFMSKYYGETPRNEDTNLGSPTGGTPKWDMASFNRQASVLREGLVDPSHFADLRVTDIQSSDPEVAASLPRHGRASSRQV